MEYLARLFHRVKKSVNRLDGSLSMIGKTDVMVAWARIMFGFWLLSTAILFLINYRAYLPPEINRHIQQGLMLHVAGFLSDLPLPGSGSPAVENFDRKKVLQDQETFLTEVVG